MPQLHVRFSSDASVTPLTNLTGRFVVDQRGARVFVMKLDHAQGWEYAVLHLSDQDSWRMELFDNPRMKAPMGLPLEVGRLQVETQGLRPTRADGLAPGMIAVTDEGTWFVAKYWQEGELALVRISDGAIAPAYDFHGLVSDQWSLTSERDGAALLSNDEPMKT